MLHKILLNLNHPFHCKLPQFSKATQQNLSWQGITSINYLGVLPVFTTSLWIRLPNEVVLVVKQDHFIALAMIKNYY